LSPLAWPLAYRFPVHKISPDYQPSEPLEQPGLSATAYLKAVAEQLQHPQPEIIYESGLKIVQDLAARNIILLDAQT